MPGQGDSRELLEKCIELEDRLAMALKDEDRDTEALHTALSDQKYSKDRVKELSRQLSDACKAWQAAIKEKMEWLRDT